eukprot:gene459-832_t
MEGIQSLTSLKSLWLGKNKIEQMSHLENLQHLKQLDIQNNRLTAISCTSTLFALEELYLAHNNIQSAEGLYELATSTSTSTSDSIESSVSEMNLTSSSPSASTRPVLNTLDLSYNLSISSFIGIENLPLLSELWMSSTKVSSFESIELLKNLENLSCIYLEHSPISTDFEYRKRITLMLPSVEQIDAVSVSRS